MDPVISDAEAIERFDEIMDWIVANDEMIIVEKVGMPPVVLMSYNRYKSPLQADKSSEQMPTKKQIS